MEPMPGMTSPSGKRAPLSRHLSGGGAGKNIQAPSSPSLVALVNDPSGALLPGPKVQRTSRSDSTVHARLRLVMGSPLSDSECALRFVQSQRNSLCDAVVAQYLHGRRMEIASGAQYRAQALTARSSWFWAPPSATLHLCVVLCYRSSAWVECNDDFDIVGPGKLFGWRSPRLLPGSVVRGQEEVVRAYEAAYTTAAKVRSLQVLPCVNPAAEELTNGLRQLRQSAGPAGKILLHYSGHGVSRPRGNYFFLQTSSSSSGGESVKYTVDAVRANAQYPLIVIADCPSAGTILNAFLEAHRREEEQSMQRFRSAAVGVVGGASGAGAMAYSSSALDTEMSPDTASLRGLDASTLRTPVGQNPPNSLLNTPSPSGPGALVTSSVPMTIRDDFFFIGACAEGEMLPSHGMLPNDILSACITTPVTMSILWFMVSRRALCDLHPILAHVLPGAASDKKTPLGILSWAFESYMDSIAWSVLSAEQFCRLFRKNPPDNLLTNVFRGYLLAHRLIHDMNGQVVVYPPMPPLSHNHLLWESWDMQVEKALAALYHAVKPPPSRSLPYHEFRDFLDVTTAQSSMASLCARTATSGNVNVQPHFMTEEMVTIHCILDRFVEQGFYRFHSGGGGGTGGDGGLPLFERLPFLFHGCNFLSHREDAVRLLCRFFDLGVAAVAQGVEMQLFAISLKGLWKHPVSVGHRPALMFIYAKAMYVDPAIVTEEVRNDMMPVLLMFLRRPMSVDDIAAIPTQCWQLRTLRQFALPAGQVALAASLLTMSVVVSPAAQGRCVESGALDAVCFALRSHCCSRTTDGSHSPSTPVDLSDDAAAAVPAVLGASSPYVTATQQVDVEVEMKVCLMACLCALMFNLPVVDDTTDSNSTTATGGGDGQASLGSSSSLASAVPLSAFTSALQSILDPLRVLLSDEIPSVRLAAVRTIAVIVAHPSLRPPGNTDKRSAVQPSLQTRSAPVLSQLLMLVLERCEKALPFEASTDVLLDCVGLACTTLQRHGPSLLDQVPGDVVRRLLMPSTKQHTVQGLSANAGGGLQALSTRSQLMSGASHPALRPEIMSPFVLPSQVQPLTSVLSVNADSDDESGVPAMESWDPDAGDSGGSAGHSPSANPRGSAAALCLARVPRSAPKPFQEITSAILRAQHIEPVSEIAYALILCMRYLKAGCSHASPSVRAHCDKAIAKLLASQSFSLRNYAATNANYAFASSTYRGSLDSRNLGISVGSKKPSTGLFSAFFSRKGSSRAAAGAAAAKGPITPPAAPASGGSGQLQYDAPDDEEEEVTLRVVQYDDASTVHPFIYEALSFLDEISLVPHDDHDPRNPHKKAAIDALRRFADTAAAVVEVGCRSSSLSVGPSTVSAASASLPHEAVLQSLLVKDIPEVEAIAFHPTENLAVVAHSVDCLKVLPYDDFRDDAPSSRSVKPLLTFRVSDVVKRWQPRVSSGIGAGANPFPPSQSVGSLPSALASGTGFDSASDVDGHSEPPLTPHSRSFVRDTGIPSSSGTSAHLAGTQGSDFAVSIGSTFFMDASRADPVLGVVQNSGAVSLFAVNLEALRSGSPVAVSENVHSVVQRLSTFETMSLENRQTSVECIAAYHSVAQQIHLTAPDGTLSSWDLTTEQLTGIRFATQPHGPGDGSSSGSSGQPFVGLSSRVTSLGVHPVDPFRFAAGSHTVILFDTRSPRPASRMDYSGRSMCLFVGFSLRYEHLLMAGFSGDSSFVAWDDRKLPVVLPGVAHATTEATPKFGAQSPTAGQNQGTSARGMGVHAVHPDLLSFTLHPSSAHFVELLSRGTKKMRVKDPSCAAFHPIAPILALAENGKFHLLQRSDAKRQDTQVRSVMNDAVTI